MRASVIVAVALCLGFGVLAGCAQPQAAPGNPSAGVPTYQPPSAPPSSPKPSVGAGTATLKGTFVAAANDTSLLVRWVVEYSGYLSSGQTILSHVEVRAPGTNLRSADQRGVGEHDALVTGLRANTSYTIQVVTSAPGGATLASTPIVHATAKGHGELGAALDGNLTGLRSVVVDAITSSGADIHWRVLGNGSIASTIHYGTDNLTRLSLGPFFGPGDHTTALTDLSRDTTYFLRVTAAAGTKNATSTTVIFHTPDLSASGSTIRPTPSVTPDDTGSAPNSPPTLSISAVQGSGSDSIKVGYTVTGSGAISVKADYGATTSYGLSTTPSTVSASSGILAINGLQSNQLYHLRLVATNSAGTATTSDRTALTFAKVQVNLINAGYGAGSCKVTVDGVAIALGADAPIQVAKNTPNANRIEFVVTNQQSQPHRWILMGPSPVAASATDGDALADSDPSGSFLLTNDVYRNTGLDSATGGDYQPFFAPRAAGDYLMFTNQGGSTPKTFNESTGNPLWSNPQSCAGKLVIY